MVKRTLAWGLTLAIGGALLFSAASDAAGPADHWLGRLQTELQLSNDQVSAIQVIIARYAPSQRQLFQTLRQSEATLRQLALNGADETTLQQKMVEIQGLLAQGVQLRVKRLQEISPLPTPEQREQFAQLKPHGPRMRGAPGAAPAPGPSS